MIRQSNFSYMKGNFKIFHNIKSLMNMDNKNMITSRLFLVQTLTFQIMMIKMKNKQKLRNYSYSLN
jgi:hypothetical protein